MAEKTPEAIYQKLSAKAAEAMGLPTGFKTFSPFPFGGMNQQASRVAIGDPEFYIRENFIRIGDGDLRTLWDFGTSRYTVSAGKTIVSFFFFNIGNQNYAAVFLSDGTAVQVAYPSGTQTIMSITPGTFYTSGSPLPACAQWGTLYLLIANNITPDSYWVWDGSILYSAGTLAPEVTITSGGTGYSSAPTVTAFGGSGSGVIANAVISNGSVVLVTLSNPGTGYLPGDVVQLAFSGGGSDSSAILQAVLAAGTIGHVQLIAAGTGYTPGTYALGFSGGSGSGAAGTFTVDSSTTVVSTNLTSGGTGYTGSPTVTFPGAGGSGAIGVAILDSNTVASVTIVNGGTGFTSTPTLTFQGGGGTGATATATLTAGVITGVTVTAGGSGYTSDPAVIVQSGTNNAASVTANLMPFGVSGSSIETFQQRVWLPFPNQTGNQENGGTFLLSAPGSLTDFAPSDGGLTYTSTDSFLRYQYTNIKQSNGYLYPIGDSSVDVISNVQTSGNPPTTTFNYQNVDPQTGTSWRDTVVAFSRTILMSNPLGVYGVYGGSVTKVSEKMDDLFTNMVSPQRGGVVPSASVANIFSRKIFLQLMTITDVFTNTSRNVMIAWDEKEWFLASQSINLIYIGTQEINSDITSWGTDGNSLFPLFNSPSSNLTKTLATKLYGATAGFIIKQAMSLYAQAIDQTEARVGVLIQAAINNELSSYSLAVPVSSPADTLKFPSTASVFPVATPDVVGLNLGVTLTSTSPDFSLNNLIIGYIDVDGLFGSTYLNGFGGE